MSQQQQSQLPSNEARIELAKSAIRQGQIKRVLTAAMTYKTSESILRTRLNGTELRFRGKELLDSLSWIMSTVCLVGDAQRDNRPVMVEVSKRWIGEKQAKASIETQNWKNISVLDKLVVFGVHSTGSKL
ncbi:hypothetical protein P152DRAFT_456380 [Eremomyces bilateralis CBS 781.70]|uniref:Uncharacterized protein n=1 Tax=Eremomyces bilateralis CBS 781.70 TaxID=1392243 RepID=A0A6G1G898_9PEZI|nr:uncharacterized protein P152DRAFT_456380 [Eremomyces bilateralis CBS 781.70]KAF1814151.1 hypothetical protein P152DRAFT_456380 [Eremomyces bilateralis CBS 781.70]